MNRLSKILGEFRRKNNFTSREQNKTTNHINMPTAAITLKIYEWKNNRVEISKSENKLYVLDDGGHDVTMRMNTKNIKHCIIPENFTLKHLSDGAVYHMKMPAIYIKSAKSILIGHPQSNIHEVLHHHIMTINQRLQSKPETLTDFKIFYDSLKHWSPLIQNFKKKTTKLRRTTEISDKIRDELMEGIFSIKEDLLDIRHILTSIKIHTTPDLEITYYEPLIIALRNTGLQTYLEKQRLYNNSTSD